MTRVRFGPIATVNYGVVVSGVIAVFVLSMASIVLASTPLGSQMTYQGQLSDGGVPADGSFDFEFNIWDDQDPAVGSFLGQDTHMGVVVSGGLFSVLLDFGPEDFTGMAVWLEIKVRPAGGGAYTELRPLQDLTATPYALYAPSAGDAATAQHSDTANDADTLDGVDATGFVSTSGDIISGDLIVTGSVDASTLCIDSDCRTLWPTGGSTPWMVSGTHIYSSNSGNVGIGVTGPTQKLHVGGHVLLEPTSEIWFTDSDVRIQPSGDGLDIEADRSGGSDIDIDARDDVTIEAGDDVFVPVGDKFHVQNAERILLEGKVGIATFGPPSTPLFELHVDGDAGKTEGGTSWASISDRRLKDIEGKVHDVMPQLLALNPVRYRWNSLYKSRFSSDSNALMYGFLAQDIQEVFPEMVWADDDGYLWYNPSGFEAILVSGIQSQQRVIANLNNRIESLEQQVETLREAIASR